MFRPKFEPILPPPIMARATSPTASDASDNQPSKQKATDDPESEDEGEDGEEEEYEIEAIIDAKRGVFGEVGSIWPELHNASDPLRVGAYRIPRQMEGL